MKNIAYMGNSDARSLTSEDFKQAGVDTEKDHMFPRKTPVEVTNAIAEQLLSRPEIFGQFEEVGGEPVGRADQLDFDALQDQKAEELNQEATSLDTPQTGVDTPAAPAAPRRGGRASTASTS